MLAIRPSPASPNGIRKMRDGGLPLGPGRRAHARVGSAVRRCRDLRTGWSRAATAAAATAAATGATAATATT